MVATSTSASQPSQQVERAVTAVFTDQAKIDAAIRRLLDRAVLREDISVMGRNFHTETRITGFLTRRDVILGGLKNGGIFGSLFGSVLALLTGVGVLFIPFVGPVVAAGPLGAVLLGAASGAIAGSAGAGLVSVFAALGMPEDKAAIYQTRVEAGDFLLMAEVPADRSGEIQLLLESAGGEEVSTTQTALPRGSTGPIQSVQDLSPEVRSHLSDEAQQTYIEHYNRALSETSSASEAEHAAWDTIRTHYVEGADGRWSKAS
ncbi:ChaB family protein [Leptolyngbya sp. FACHB-261]|uniref:ChaB family protein n=1 Tax=Leptolyngbya sp. FACHB-261 TaxID=2692806 RepID=UPI001684EA22|nr:ChaB family protein [Leptolyngbya sp. FACHB-261]MBD2104926.1 ChaB family protein [Leptolyngbya sp. FACHB-261]